MRKFSIVLWAFLLSFSAIAQSTIDFRRFQTPIKNQGQRGTCTAFAVASALETLPGVPADISEQYLYGALKHSQTEVPYHEGDRLANYINSLKMYGFIHEANLPYNPKALNWIARDTDFERMISGSQMGKVSLLLLQYWAKYSVSKKEQYEYHEFTGAANPEVIKTMLQNGNKAVVVTYSYVHIPTWGAGEFTAENPLDINDMVSVKLEDEVYTFGEAAKIYNGDLVADILAEKLEAALNNAVTVHPETGEEINNYGGHAVTIVGYNPNGFIFKNSWGADWCDKGYGYISYEAHRFMCQEALAINAITFQEPKLRSDVDATTQFILKSTLAENNKLQLSIYTYDYLSDPLISSVGYRVYNVDNELIDERFALSPIGGNYDNSFTVKLFNGGKHPLMPPGVLFKNESMRVEIEVYVAGSDTPKTFIYTDVKNATKEYYNN